MTLAREVERALPAKGHVMLQRVTDEQWLAVQKFEDRRLKVVEIDRKLVVL
jgi:hypothetical protein